MCPTRHELPNEHLIWKMQNELAHLIALNVKNINLLEVVSNKFFSISGNETTDVRKKSMFSLLHRAVDDHLEVAEIFSGVHVIANKKSETIADKMKVSPPSDRHH